MEKSWNVFLKNLNLFQLKKERLENLGWHSGEWIIRKQSHFFILIIHCCEPPEVMQLINLQLGNPGVLHAYNTVLLYFCRSVQRFWKACVVAALERLRKPTSYTERSVRRSTPIRWPSCPQAMRKTWRLRSTETPPQKLRSWPMICEPPKRLKDWGRRWNGMRCGTATVKHLRRLPPTTAILWGTSCDLLHPQKLQLGLTDNDCILEWGKKRRGMGGDEMPILLF